MGVVVIKDKIRKKDLHKAGKDYGEYIKIVVDVESGIIAIGGQWHADGERLLLETGCRQDNLWGGGIDIKSRKIETIAIINLRPNRGNDSQEILDQDNRQKFITIVRKKFSV